jgi:hypothetical protein
MSSTSHGATPYYYVPHASRHPAMAAFGLFLVILGAGQWINGEEWGKYSLFRRFDLVVGGFVPVVQRRRQRKRRRHVQPQD